MPIERPPATPLPQNYVPSGGKQYQVTDTDDWSSVARKFHIDAGALIEFNFKTRKTEEVNWYLRRNVGCNRPTKDGKNWMFAGAKPGLIYIPPPAPPAPIPSNRIVHSIGATSWIDQRLFDPKELPEVDHYNTTPDMIERGVLVAKSGYRFANFLEAFVVVNDQQEITDQGFTDDSNLYFGPSFKGIMPKGFPVQRKLDKAQDRKSVRFVQTVGAQTMSPQVIGAREGVKFVDRMLGITPGWGGPLGVQAESAGAQAGVTAAENFKVFPPIWTVLELTIYSDAGFDTRLVKHSIFPSNSFYRQSYTVELLSTNSTKYSLVQSYDARTKIDEWRKNGWGSGGSTSGPSGGNPWAVADPRILGRDLPFAPAPPSD